MISPGAIGPVAKLAALTTAWGEGGGVPIVRLTAFDGTVWGVTTTIDREAANVKVSLESENWRVFASTNVVGRVVLPSNDTAEDDVKPEPVTVKVVPPEFSGTTFGEMAVITGAGARTLSVTEMSSG